MTKLPPGFSPGGRTSLCSCFIHLLAMMLRCLIFEASYMIQFLLSREDKLQLRTAPQLYAHIFVTCSFLICSFMKPCKGWSFALWPINKKQNFSLAVGALRKWVGTRMSTLLRADLLIRATLENKLLEFPWDSDDFGLVWFGSVWFGVQSPNPLG